MNQISDGSLVISASLALLLRRFFFLSYLQRSSNETHMAVQRYCEELIGENDPHASHLLLLQLFPLG